MIELELFYKTVEAEIRRKHIKFLKKQKCLPDGSAAQMDGSSEQSEIENGENGEDKETFERVTGEGKAKLVKQFNKGVDMALKVLSAEYGRFDKRLKDEEQKGKKF